MNRVLGVPNDTSEDINKILLKYARTGLFAGVNHGSNLDPVVILQVVVLTTGEELAILFEVIHCSQTILVAYPPTHVYPPPLLVKDTRVIIPGCFHSSVWLDETGLFDVFQVPVESLY